MRMREIFDGIIKVYRVRYEFSIEELIFLIINIKEMVDFVRKVVEKYGLKYGEVRLIMGVEDFVFYF